MKARARLAAVLAASSIVFASAAPAANEARSLADAISDQVNRHLPSSAARLSPTAARESYHVLSVVLKFSYFHKDVAELRAAALAAIESADPNGASASSLNRAAVEAVLNSIGHGAHWYDAQAQAQMAAALPARRNAQPTPAVQQLDGANLISLPSFTTTMKPVADSCAWVADLLAALPIQAAVPLILDLRGNGGGLLTDVECVASHFVASDVPLYTIVARVGESSTLKSRSRSPAHLLEPMAVLIDQRTNSGGLLLAAVLQDLRHALVVGEQAADISGAITNVVPIPEGGIVLVPIGELLHDKARPLAAGIRVDIATSEQDAGALVQAALHGLHPAAP